MAKWSVGTPDEILNNPANDYVRTFFRGVDISQVFSAKDIARRSPVGLIRKTPGFGPRSALKLLQDEDREYGYVIERGNRFVGIVSIDSLKTALSAGQGIEAALIDAPLAVEAQTPLSDLLSHVGHAPCAVPVVDEEQQYIGIISKRMLLQALDREGESWLIRPIHGAAPRQPTAPRRLPTHGVVPLLPRRLMAAAPTGCTAPRRRSRNSSISWIRSIRP